MNNFLYGMWFCLCVIAWKGSYAGFAMGAIIIPGLVVLLARGVWFLVKFKWEKRNG